MRALVQIRYRHNASEAEITQLPDVRGSNTVRVIFDEPQRGITPGQAAGVYNGDTLIGGGWSRGGFLMVRGGG